MRKAEEKGMKTPKKAVEKKRTEDLSKSAVNDKCKMEVKKNMK